MARGGPDGSVIRCSVDYDIGKTSYDGAEHESEDRRGVKDQCNEELFLWTKICHDSGRFSRESD